MKHWSLVIVALAIVGAVYFYPVIDDSSEVIELQEPQMGFTQELGQSHADGTVLIPTRSIERARPTSETLEVTEEQRTAVMEQEEKILNMAREYEEVRSDPEKRQVLREQMRQELAVYSEAVLPIALEKIKAAQSTN